jgi:hypothetical protein
MKNGKTQFYILFQALTSKKNSFLPLGKWKNKILFQKNYNCYANVVHNGNTHGSAKFGQVIMNYAMDVAMTMGRCIEIHTSS